MDLSKKTDKKGFGFEYKVSAMFQSQGYLTRRGIPLHYGSSNLDATDIDVLGIMFTGPFQGHRIICDCKNKTRAKPYERIFWAKGLGEFVKASNVFVALNKTQWEIIRFASMGGVKVLTSEMLDEYRGTYPAYGLADASFYEPYENKVAKVAKTNSLVSKVFSNVKKLYLSENPYVTINIAMEFLSNISGGLQFSDRHASEHLDTLKYLACELTVIVGLQVLWICSDVLGLPDKARREHIASKLTFGDLEPKAARSIISNAKELAREIIMEAVPKSLVPKVLDFGDIPSPEYTDSLIGLVERALARPEWYLKVPQHLDFMLFEQGLKGNISDVECRSIFGYGIEDQRFKVARNILSFVRNATGLDWKTMWGKGKNNASEPTKLDENPTSHASNVNETSSHATSEQDTYSGDGEQKQPVHHQTEGMPDGVDSKVDVDSAQQGTLKLDYPQGGSENGGKDNI